MAKISAYSIIGNCRSAALVSKEGSIDWCCFPEFHSPAVFSALLDRSKGGFFAISPTASFLSKQVYVEDTNVLETVFTCSEGEVKLVDAFSVAAESDKSRQLFPDHEILRMVHGVSGRVRMKVTYVPRMFYGKQDVRLQNNKKLGIKFSSEANSYLLQSTLAADALVVNEGLASAEFSIGEGEQVAFSLSCSTQAPAILPELQSTADSRMEQTIAWWKNWTAQCRYKGFCKDEVKRSALVLKLLAHAPTGAIIAAPTTSLPEEAGGVRNWDYRYCWLRDASFTVRALLKLGYMEETRAYLGWILHATRLTQPRLQVVYSVFGQSRVAERELSWLEGFEGSRPVRIGNGAYDQFQLDVYGEVLDAFFSYSEMDGRFDRGTKNFIIGLADMICTCWEQPDNGIWEIRSSRKHHTHSKLMAWVGLDRVVRLIEKYNWPAKNLDRYKRTRASIRDCIEQFGFNEAMGTYVADFGGTQTDASALVFSLVGYCDAASPKMLSTVRNICSRLSVDGLVYRYRGTKDGVSGSEGCFGVCSFWLAENLARSGNIEHAIGVFEKMLSHANETGLLSEEIDPDTGALLGNFPQGFTHIGLINAALSINEALEKGGRPS